MLPAEGLRIGQVADIGDVESARLVVTVDNAIVQGIVALVQVAVIDRGKGDAVGLVDLAPFLHCEASAGELPCAGVSARAGGRCQRAGGHGGSVPVDDLGGFVRLVFGVFDGYAKIE